MLKFEVELKVWDWKWSLELKVDIVGVVGGEIDSDHWKCTGLKNIIYEVEK